MKILVTGGSGFIGSNFIRHVLASRGSDFYASGRYYLMLPRRVAAVDAREVSPRCAASGILPDRALFSLRGDPHGFLKQIHHKELRGAISRRR